VEYPYRVVIDDAATVMPDDQRDVLKLIRAELDWVGSGRLHATHDQLIVMTASLDEALRIADEVAALISERGWWIVVSVQKRDHESRSWLDVEPSDEPVEVDDSMFVSNCPDWALAAAKVVAVLPNEVAAQTLAAQMWEAGVPARVDGREVSIPSVRVEEAWLTVADLERIVPPRTKLRVRGVRLAERQEDS